MWGDRVLNMLYVDPSVASAMTTGGLASFIPLIMFGVYLLPTIIALSKRNRRLKVALFNIFLGWTVVIWVFCMVWACKREVKVETKETDMQNDVNKF